MGGAVKKIKKVVTGGGSSSPAPAPSPAPAATVATTTPSVDGNVEVANYVKPKGKRSLIKGIKGGGGYNVGGGDFALFLEELMKRKTLG